MAGYQPWNEQIPGMNGGTPGQPFTGPFQGAIGAVPPQPESQPPQLNLPPPQLPGMNGLPHAPMAMGPTPPTPPQPMGPRPMNIPTPNLQAPAIPGTTPIHPQSGLTKRGALLTDIGQGLQQFQGAMQRGDAQRQAQLYARGDAVLQMLQAAGQNPDPTAARQAQEKILAQPGAVEALRARGVALPGGESQGGGILSKIVRGVSGTTDRSGQSAPLPPGSMNEIPQVSPAAIAAQQAAAQQTANQGKLATATGNVLNRPGAAEKVAENQLGLAPPPAVAEDTEKDMHIGNYVNDSGNFVAVMRDGKSGKIYEEEMGKEKDKEAKNPNLQAQDLYLKNKIEELKAAGLTQAQAEIQAATAWNKMAPEIRAQAIPIYQMGSQPVEGPNGQVGMPVLNKRSGQIDVSNVTPAAGFKADAGSLAALTKQRDSVTAFENTAGKNLDLFLKQADATSRTGIPLANQPLQWLQQHATGSPEIAAYNASRQAALSEIAKVISNPNLTGVLSDSARKEVEQLIPPDATGAQIKSAAAILKQDMANRKGSYDQQIQEIKGRMGQGGGSQQQPAAPKAFSVSSWKGKNPTGDVNAAVAQATQQGLKVIP